jgi:hypothetical protein
MIKAAGRTGLGLPLLLLGLSGENVTRLAAGEPIRIPAAQMAALGLPQMEVVIHYGRTEDDIVEELKAHGIAQGETPAPDTARRPSGHDRT